MSKTAFVFAGQGAQSVGMGQDFFDKYKSAKDIFDMSDKIRDLCFNGVKEELDITINTQPAVFLVDMICATVLTEKGIKADGVAGFSLGEIPAVTYAGLIDIKNAFDFINHRAKAMNDCAEKTKGVMFAVLKLSDEKVEEICKKISDAYPVNYNSPGQVVVACAESSADALIQAVSIDGGKAMQLKVSGAFHSPFMNEASKSAEEYLENVKFSKTNIPVYSNTTAKTYENSGYTPKKLLSKQINNPVLWKKTIENMIADGFNKFIEVGPGKTLTGLIKKINPDVETYNVYDIESLDKTIEELKNA